MEEIEINFKLDQNGRTVSAKASENQPSHEDADADIYDPKTIDLEFHNEKQDAINKIMDDLLYDAEISDNALMPRTYWISAHDKPRFSLEQLAHDIFHLHTKGLTFDVETSGAEWWVQLRPSPDKIGRYAVLEENTDDISKTGISFHWDKDEDLRILCGGTTYIHPHVSTVTYLTDLGAPTMAFNYRVHSLSGEWILPDADQPLTGFISWPRARKHLSFDGRYLHAAPPDVMETGSFAKQIAHTPSKDPTEAKKQARRFRRATFLVNVWLNYKPFNVQSFPETMADKMSGCTDPTDIVHASPRLKDVSKNLKEFQVTGASNEQLTEFTWPMGDSDSGEFIHVSLPLYEIRVSQHSGGNISLKWMGKNRERCANLLKETPHGVTSEKSIKRARTN